MKKSARGGVCNFNLNEKHEIQFHTICSLVVLLNTENSLLFDSLVGEIQRNLDCEHLEKLKAYQETYYTKYNTYFFSNPIILVKLGTKFAIVDGQHRFQTMMLLFNKNPERFDNCYIPVVVNKIDDIGDYDVLFTAINQSKPVPLYLNNTMWKTTGKRLENYFVVTHPSYVKQSLNPRYPNINPQKIIDYIDRHDLFSNVPYETIVMEIEELNNFYLKHWRKYLQNTGYVKNASFMIQQSKKKCSSHPLVVGICGGLLWLETINAKIQKNKHYSKMQHLNTNFKPFISRLLRGNVWRKRNTDVWLGHCYVCNNEIFYDNFVCGHVLSVFRGGKTDISNLEPICSGCDMDMGLCDLEAYRSLVNVK
jgi:hypothetical protein